MATYEFICSECGTILDENHTMGKCPDETTCSCGKRAKRMYEAPEHYWKNCTWPGGYKDKLSSNEGRMPGYND